MVRDDKKVELLPLCSPPGKHRLSSRVFKAKRILWSSCADCAVCIRELVMHFHGL